MAIRRAEGTPSESGFGGVEQEHYEGPSGGTSYQKGYRQSFETSGGAFTTRGLTQGRVIGYSGQSRSSLVNWDAGATNTPSFNK
jgi:hypothetical protein